MMPTNDPQNDRRRTQVNGHGAKWTRKRENAIAALVSESTVIAAAAKVGIGEVTLRRWMKDPEFSAAYTAARDQLIEGAVSELQRRCIDAVQVLHTIATDKRCQPAARVSAARAIIDSGFKGTEIRVIVERIAALEKRCDEGKTK